MHSFRKKVVVITGAVGNLGRATAHVFQRAGAHTALVDRAGDRLHHQFSDLVVSPDHLLLGGVNLIDEAAVASAVGSAVERFGHIDVLVNTVGAWRGGAATHEAPLADWDTLFAAISGPPCSPAARRSRISLVNAAERSSMWPPAED